MEQFVWTIVIPVCAAAIVGTGLCALVAIVSPRTFGAIASFMSRRVETNRLLAWLDKEVRIDEYVLRHSRLFGFIALASLLLAVWLAF